MPRTARQRLNPFDTPSVVDGYENWYCTVGQRADKLEKALLERLHYSFPHVTSVIEVGCGTGHFTRWFAGLGLEVTGLDLSKKMLQEAIELGNPAYVQGDALTLPFPPGSFDIAAVITTLEFVDDPLCALKEMIRVARSGLILGALNRLSLLGRRLKAEGGPIWGDARFFDPGELADLVRQAADGRRLKIHWLTTLWPLWSGALALPWGGFIGLSVRLL